MAVPIVERVAHAGVVADEVACEHQQVVELEPPGTTPLVDGGAHEFRGGAHELVNGGGGDRVDGALHGGVGESEGFDDGGLVAPVALLAEAGSDRRTRREYVEGRALVGCGPRECGAECGETLEVPKQLVGGIETIRGHRDGDVEGGDCFGQVEGRDGSVRRKALVDEPIPIVVDDLGQRLEAGHSEAERPHHGERPLERQGRRTAGRGSDPSAPRSRSRPGSRRGPRSREVARPRPETRRARVARRSEAWRWWCRRSA